MLVMDTKPTGDEPWTFIEAWNEWSAESENKLDDYIKNCLPT